MPVEDITDWAHVIENTSLTVNRISAYDFVEAENVFSQAESRLLQGIIARLCLRFQGHANAKRLGTT